MSRSRPCLAEPPALSPSTMNSSDSVGVGAVAVVELAGEVQAVADGRLAADLVGGGPAGLAGPGGLDHPGGDRVADAPVLEQEVFQPGADHRLDQRPDLRVVQTTLGLSLELGLVDADRQDRRQAFADVLALDLEPLLEVLVFLHELGDRRPDGLPEARLVSPAVAGRDRVDVRPDVLVGRLGPGEGHVAAELVVLALQNEGKRAHSLVAPGAC